MRIPFDNLTLDIADPHVIRVRTVEIGSSNMGTLERPEIIGRPEIILGAGSFGDPKRAPDAAAVKEQCDLFHRHGHRRIDHARIYPPDSPGKAEELMKESGVNKWAIFDTKATALGNKEHTKENIEQSLDASFKALGAMIDVFYLHMPAHDTPFEETMEAVNKAHKEGKFNRLGLSNQSPEQVEELVAIAEQNGKKSIRVLPLQLG
jgi:aflatoxin B1 aldehyde reductase